MEWFFYIGLSYIGKYSPIYLCIFHFPHYYCTVKIDSYSLGLCCSLYWKSSLKSRQFSDYVSFLPSGLNKDRIKSCLKSTEPWLFKSCVFVYPIFFWFITFRWNYEERKWKDTFRIEQNETLHCLFILN